MAFSFGWVAYAVTTVVSAVGENRLMPLPDCDWIYMIGFATSIVQLGIAAIPCGVYGDWGILLVTASGIVLSFATGALAQWKREKWACRHNTEKTVVLTKGNGSQHAIVIIGDNKGLDFEDLATGPVTLDNSASSQTRFALIVLAALWILLLITAASLHQNTWFLLAVGGIGMLQNIFVAGARRTPKDFGVPLVFEAVIAEPKVMDTLFAVEKAYPRVGRSMRETFFPASLHPKEKERWEEFEMVADALDESMKSDGERNGNINAKASDKQSHMQEAYTEKDGPE